MSDLYSAYREKCLTLIEGKLNWGESSRWTNNDFQELSRLIYDTTNVLLSATTLKRIWGKIKYDNTPTDSTMDALVGFLGYPSWKAFILQQKEPDKPTDHKQLKRASANSYFIWIITLIIAAVATWAFISQKKDVKNTEYPMSLSDADFSLSSKSIIKKIPTSVVFTYDATASPTDSIYIQQDWDKTKRKRIEKGKHIHTSIYHLPGHYNAKLIVGDKVVKKNPLIIPTDGWLGTIGDSKLPIYLKNQEFTKKTHLAVSDSIIRKYNYNPSTELVSIRYYNVGNFKPVPINKFEFSAIIKNNANEGINACQRSGIGLLTEGMAISIPLSNVGCISDLSVTSVDKVYSGKENDLSKFGTNISDWVKVKCVGTENSITYFINDELAYEAPLVSDSLQIIGLVFGFSGGGSVKNIRLSSDDKEVFQQF